MKIRMHTEFDTELSPAGVVAALTDFGPSRPETWPNIDPEKYVVHEVNDSSAVVTEGNKSPNIWARERYEWSPSRVRWTVEESNFCAPGSYVEAAVEPRETSGSHVSVDWERTPTSSTGYLVSGMVKALPKRVFAKSIKASLDDRARAA